MAKLEGQNGVLKAVMEYDGLQALSFHGPEMARVRDAVLQLHMTVNITEFEWKQLADPLDYRYEFTVTDGRVWRQTLRFDSPTDPTMDWSDITGVWRVSEFVAHRDLRDLMVELQQGVGLTKCKVTIL